MMLAGTREFETSDTVVYPLLCKLVLELTACYQNVVDCSADHTVITNILFWLISVARKSRMTAFCMYQQVSAVCWNWADVSRCVSCYTVSLCHFMWCCDRQMVLILLV